MLENVAVDERGVLDLDDDSKTENTRAAYKLERIANALPTKRAGHPSSVVFLTADAFGILPPIARLDARPGDVLLPLRASPRSSPAPRSASPSRSRPSRPASARRSCRSRRPSTRGCSARSSTRTASSVWLVNTGWTGGPFGDGHRMPIAATRAAAARGALGRARRRRVPHRRGLRLRGAGRRPGVDAALLDPRSTWRDPAAYDAKARELAAMFRENFEKFAADAGAARSPREPARAARIRAAGRARPRGPSDLVRAAIG